MSIGGIRVHRHEQRPVNLMLLSRRTVVAAALVSLPARALASIEQCVATDEEARRYAASLAGTRHGG